MTPDRCTHRQKDNSRQFQAVSLWVWGGILHYSDDIHVLKPLMFHFRYMEKNS